MYIKIKKKWTMRVINEWYPIHKHMSLSASLCENKLISYWIFECPGNVCVKKQLLEAEFRRTHIEHIQTPIKGKIVQTKIMNSLEWPGQKLKLVFALKVEFLKVQNSILQKPFFMAVLKQIIPFLCLSLRICACGVKEKKINGYLIILFLN